MSDWDVVAEAIFRAAMNENRAGELLAALFDGGSATVDQDGRLVILPGAQLDQLDSGVPPSGGER
jgi:hypothetical protein